MHRRSVAHTPQQNGLAERANLTLGNVMRCLLVQSGVPPSCWAEALQTACHIISSNKLRYHRTRRLRLSKAESRHATHCDLIPCPVMVPPR
ncbi:hypothetical protein J437_LFUL008736 [Ladona fulva]|uniref:Integrase catalytic domain-containing protein n=1 Tax=Ladona fulva TaxID=123851 RepID=A0A8K0K5K4_LADFU|nr:hypothetical protein J437_LFUL008736 [Ladona fulva]